MLLAYVCLARSGKGNAAKDIIFLYKTLKSYIKKISKRNDIEKTRLHLVIRHPISIRQCFFHTSEWQEEFGAAERCWIGSPAHFYLAKQWNTRAAELQTSSAPSTLAPNYVWPLPIPRSKSRTLYPGVPAPSLGFLGRTMSCLCTWLQYWTRNPGTVNRAASLSCHSL